MDFSRSPFSDSESVAFCLDASGFRSSSGGPESESAQPGARAAVTVAGLALNLNWFINLMPAGAVGGPGQVCTVPVTATGWQAVASATGSVQSP